MVVTRMAYRKKKRAGGLWAGAAVCAALFAGIWAYWRGSAADGGASEADRAAAGWVTDALAGSDSFWKTVTTFGETLPIAAAAIVLTIVAAIASGWRKAIWLPIAAAAAYAINTAVKLAAERERPAAAWGIEADGASFPSANAMLALTILFMFAIVASRSRRWPAWASAAVWIAAVALTLGMGLSRLYFSVHYATDIVAGYALGGAVVFAAAALSARST